MRKTSMNYSSPEEILPLIFKSKIVKLEGEKGKETLKKMRLSDGVILILFPSEKSTMGDWLEFIKITLNASWEEVARILGVRERTVQRWRKGQDFPRAKNLEKIRALKELCSLLSEYPEALRARFLATRDPVTQKTPAELLKEGQINEVMEQLYALAEGGAY